MAPCCTNTVTPTMIKKGQMQIGDRIQFDDNDEDILTSSQEKIMKSESETFNVQSSSNKVSQAEERNFSDMQAQETVQQSVQMQQPQFQQPSPIPMQFQQPAPMPMQFQQPTPMPMQFQQPQMQQQAQPQSQQNQQPSTNENNMRNNLYTLSSISGAIVEPLTYSQMTPYMSNVSESSSGPNITIPQTPMTTENYEETIDSNDVQAYVGFLRTQIGRYMRIEQLIGSNLIEDRFGFLIGVGTNFIILQEITSGNIMVIDLFSIRFTYIYYSEPVFPRL